MAYLTNMALVDEKFTGKRIAVTGKMYRITRGGYAHDPFGKPGSDHAEKPGLGLTTQPPKPPKMLYNLELASETMASDGKPLRILLFQFISDDRKQLASLKTGQQLTVEGEPVAQTPDERTNYFRNCKILSPKGE